MWPFKKSKPFPGGRTRGGGYMAGPKTLSQMTPPPTSVSKVKPVERSDSEDLQAINDEFYDLFNPPNWPQSNADTIIECLGIIADFISDQDCKCEGNLDTPYDYDIACTRCRCLGQFHEQKIDQDTLKIASEEEDD